MEGMSPSDYIAGGMPLPGYFTILDAWLMQAGDSVQKEAHITGDILEVGAFLGRSSVLLGTFLRPEEQLTVCDLFEDPPDNAEIGRERDRFYAGLTEERFLANYLRFHERPPTVLRGSSAVRLAEARPESFRFIHVDGSHSFDAVRADLREVKRLAGAGALVVFDDINHRHTPGVAAAVWDAVLHDGLIPIATSAKLYATWDRSWPVHAFRERLAGLPVVMADEHEVGGHSVLELVDPPFEEEPWRRSVRRWVPPALLDGIRALRRPEQDQPA